MLEGCVLVTGVSRGLGLEVARRLLAEGSSVVGISRSETEALTSLRRAHPDTLRWTPCDLDDLDSIGSKLFKKDLAVLDRPITAVVNNAAIARGELVTDLERETLEHLIRVNLTAPMLICREAVRNMLLHGTRGAFVHVSSVCAQTGYKGLSAYSATKGGLEAFSRGLAREWGGRGIRSNCVGAGFMETEMSAALGESAQAAVIRRAALGKLASTQDVAAVVSFLLSREAGSITGETLAVDAGAR